MSYDKILKKKQDYYGETLAYFELAANDYANERIVEELEYLLKHKMIDKGKIQIVKKRIEEYKKYA